jgi:hypothetical protein
MLVNANRITRQKASDDLRNLECEGVYFYLWKVGYVSRIED